jgi:serine/threonine-protein kinase
MQNNINNYSDIVYLQRGGTSYILRAINKYTNKKVAIKIAIDRHKQDHIINESNMLSRIDHRNIIRFFDVNSIRNDQLYIVTEFLEGETLQEYIEKNGPLNYERFLHIFQEICNGLSYIHSQNIVHKDLKPRNIFLCSNGDVKIIDFGLSALTTQASNNHAKNKIKGTVDYISPAQILNPNINEKYFDIYSLGAVLYFLVVGRTMFIEKSISTKIRKKLLGYIDTSIIVNSNIRQLFLDIMSQYENKSNNINQIINKIHTQKIINSCNYVKS